MRNSFTCSRIHRQDISPTFLKVFSIFYTVFDVQLTNVMLDVFAEPSEFVNYTKEVAVDKGRSISLTCQAKGDPEPRIMWYRRGELITGNRIVNVV